MIRKTPPRRQKGYATVLTLILFVAVALSVYSMYDIGQATSEKVRLQNTTDAAAYSTGVMVARDFNFIAYTNRAMIANQAAIGQMVALASWTSYLEQEAINIDSAATLTSWIPYVGQAIKQVTRVLRQVMSRVRDVVDTGASAVIEASDLINQALSQVQRLHHLGTLYMARETFSGVVEENDPDVELALFGETAYWTSFYDAWRNYTVRNRKRLTSWNHQENRFRRERYAERTQLVQDSRDGFTRERNKRYWEFTIPLVVRGRMEKHGGTEFNMKTRRRELVWDWTSMDTESLWLGHYHCHWDGDCHYGVDETAPIGWGAAHARHENYSTDYYNYSRYRYTHRWGDAWENRTSAYSAAWDDGDNNLRKTSGLQRYYDFSRERDPKYNSSLQHPDTSSGPEFLIFLSKPADEIETMSTIAADNTDYETSDRLDIEEHGGMASNRLSALAKVQPYFSRPHRLWPKRHRSSRYNNKHEYGNMYNPYWQVRLVQPSDAERTAVAALSAGDVFEGFDF
ncbi:Tad domain-containing protein [Arhodomonas sp. AD133]|uniref:Tad domain-containing protein n=1 Tax=Arhodomonas sp. AD133 TaxID=3415009 RepID=UPI003EB865F3